MHKTWLVVADRARARIFSVASPKGPLTELEDLVHPQSRTHERDLTTDRSGRGSGGHGTMGSANTAHDNEAAEFARQVCARLEAARTRGDFARLILVAPPDFLGLLRKSQNPHVAKLVDREVPKNLSQLKSEAIREHLPEFLN